MRNRDLYGLLQTLNGLSNVKGKTFAYAVFKNKEKLEKEIEVFQKLQKPPHPDFANYDDERNLLCIMHSKKDEFQNPILVTSPDGNKRYDIEDMETFNKEYQELIDKYRYVLDEMDTAQREYNEFMENESLLELHKVKFEDLPEDIDANFLNQLKDMIS